MSALRLVGTLGRAAEARTSTDGTAWLCVEVHQSIGNVAATARKRIGQGPSAQLAARAAARHLRAGQRVCVHAAGYEIEPHPSAHLVLLGVDHLEALDPPQPRHEPKEATA